MIMLYLESLIWMLHVLQIADSRMNDMQAKTQRKGVSVDFDDLRSPQTSSTCFEHFLEYISRASGIHSLSAHAYFSMAFYKLTNNIASIKKIANIFQIDRMEYLGYDKFAWLMHCSGDIPCSIE